MCKVAARDDMVICVCLYRRFGTYTNRKALTLLRGCSGTMRKFRSWGSNKAKPDAGPALSDQRPSAQWQTTEPSVSQEGIQSQHVRDPSAAGQNNLSDEELRAMEESALEYAIQQSQQTDRYAALNLYRQSATCQKLHSVCSGLDGLVLKKGEHAFCAHF